MDYNSTQTPKELLLGSFFPPLSPSSRRVQEIILCIPYHTNISFYKKSHMSRRGDTPQNFLLAFIGLWKTQKIRILKKMKKKIAGSIIILHMCTKNQNHMRYSSWYTKWDNFFFSFWAISALYPHPPLTTQNTKILKRMKKASGDVIILNLCNKKHD